ncbi:hypothetical protein TNCV_4033761 [Trichonephila clavipes]|nr:hypothetical protein TNCV_4033761 [Trichonephila clavipes]
MRSEGGRVHVPISRAARLPFQEGFARKVVKENEESQFTHLYYYQSASREPDLFQKDNTDELMDLTLPSTKVPCRPQSPVDLTDRATDDSSCLKLQCTAYYIRKYEVLTEQSKNAINVLIKNGFTDPNDPERKC